MTTAPQTGTRIFVSHSSKDNDFGNRLVQDLRQTLGSEDAVWYDSEGGLFGGDSWWDTIKKELTERPIFIVILSPDALASEWVKDEIRIAWKQKNGPTGKHIILVHYHKCEVPEDLDTIQMISFLSPETYENAFHKLLIALNQKSKAIAQTDVSLLKSSFFPNMWKTRDTRNHILQILYEERSNHPYTFDRSELAERVGKRWQEIQPDISYLEEEGYLVTERCEIKTHTFYLLRITTTGMKLVEDELRSLRRLEVFISSPNDVREERQIVKRVLDRCNRLLSVAEHYVLHTLDYIESVPAEVGKKPQTIVDNHMRKASESDLFICLLWHRMGTPITDEETGEHFQSGTEYEFLNAYHNNQLHGKPYILLYRAMKPVPSEADSEQLRFVEAFFKRFEGEHAEFKGLYKPYLSNEAFEDMFFNDMDTVLSKHRFL